MVKLEKKLLNDLEFLLPARQCVAENFSASIKNYSDILIKANDCAIEIHTLGFENSVVIAAFLYNFVFLDNKFIEKIENKFNNGISKLILDVKQIDNVWQVQTDLTKTQIDVLRKALLTMVRDMRAVVIFLANILISSKFLKNNQDETFKHNFAEKVLHVFAPLANRLGLYHLKWQLEDLAFFYLEPKEYKIIANNLTEKRIERQARVDNIIMQLNNLLAENKISAEVYGRVKHIYSICKKMQQKNLNFKEILDTIAVRILTNDIPSCYQALSIAHKQWQPITEEFDDYIAAPKINGYQSIHTALKDDNDKIFELQIRTRQMHLHAEGGIAAHWSYKENFSNEKNYEQKVNWLRTLLSWQKELIAKNNFDTETEYKLFHERIYVFTPNGDVIDLPNGATPLDFAYHIHTDLGHKCRGAQINSVLQPLTYKLKTCDKVNILINKNGAPSRDWLLQNSGYVITTTARNKIAQWFRQQEFEHYYQLGRTLLEKELKKLNLPIPDLQTIAEKKNFKTVDMLLAALGQNSIRLASILNIITPAEKTTDFVQINNEKIKTKKIKSSIVKVSGVENVLSRIAKCCHPIPGDKIIGFITRGSGVTIHNINCGYVKTSTVKNRLIDIAWNELKENNYHARIVIYASDCTNLIKDITTILSNEKMRIIKLNSQIYKKSNEIILHLTIETSNIFTLDVIFKKISQLPKVYSVSRA